MPRQRGVIAALKVVFFACSAFAAVFFLILVIGKIFAFVKDYKSPMQKLKSRRKKLQAPKED